jgi:hypothetical protein
MTPYRAVRSFDDIRQGEPTVLQTWHGTHHADTIRREGFRAGDDVQQHGFNPQHNPLASAAGGPRAHLLSASKNEAGKLRADPAHRGADGQSEGHPEGKYRGVPPDGA